MAGTIGWRNMPAIYEIHTWTWLEGLSRRHGKPVTLGNVPASEWNAIESLGLDAVWLMGVWERSPASRAIARAHHGLRSDFLAALPDLVEDDIVGSPYAVHRYRVDDALGGDAGLAVAREALAARGMRLLLDFVPNHVAVDHPWVREHPGYLIRGDRADLQRKPGAFFSTASGVLAHGRDPYFPAWTDTAQLDAFRPEYRRAASRTLTEIGAACDGVRCDMAMLATTSIFQRTWGTLAGDPPGSEFWSEVIAAVHDHQPEFLFVAEAYWDTEWDLQNQGFDYTYDKRLYDRLRQADIESIRLHLTADRTFQDRLVRFVENHDEARAASAWESDRQRAVTVVAATVPGARLIHQGQAAGTRRRLPVQLGRALDQAPDPETLEFHRALFGEIANPLYHDGAWEPCDCRGWEGNSSADALLSWCWRLGSDRRLVVVNLSDNTARGRVPLPWVDLSGRNWRLIDRFSLDVYRRGGDEMSGPGLYVELPANGFHLLGFEATAA